MSQPPLLLTVGEIARRLDTKVHRIEYIIRSRNIEATGWAGHARVFTDATLGSHRQRTETHGRRTSRHTPQPSTRKEATR